MITRQDGAEIELDGQILPGIVDNVRIDGQVIVDKQKAEGSSKREKIFSGYDDIEISVNLILIDGEKSIQDQMSDLSDSFEGKARPEMRKINQEYINAVGVVEVYWSKLNFSYGREGAVFASLVFVEASTQKRIAESAPNNAAVAAVEETPANEEDRFDVTAEEWEAVRTPVRAGSGGDTF